MPLGGADSPFGGLELSSQASGVPAQPTQPIEDLVAGEETARDQRLEGEAAHRTAEEPEKSRAEIMASVQTEWDFCGLEETEEDAECATDILVEYQAILQTDNPAYIVGEAETQSELVEIVASGIRRGNSRRARQDGEIETTEAETTQTVTAEDEAEEDKNAETEERKALVAYETWKNEKNGDFVAAVNDAVNMPVGEPPNPELVAERAKLMAFQRILSLASTVPADAQIIRQRMAAQDFSQGIPSPVQFIQTAIFSSAEYDSGVSEATQTAIAKEFGLTPTRPERPRNASEMQSTLREGRGTEPVTEMQRVEEPPGSGNFVEKEVVVGEKTIPFNEQDRLVLSKNPLITVFPDPPGGTQHRVVGEVSGGEPVHILVDIPPEGAFPAAAINNRMNEQMMNTVFRNGGMTGVLEHFHGRGDSSMGSATETDFDSLGQNDMTQAILQTFVGENTTLGGRFISGAEMHSMEDGLRQLTPGGDFGAFNQMDPATANGLMTAMFGSDRANIAANLNRARPFINTGGAEAPSFEALYAKMYPEDATNGYERLHGIIGAKGMAQLDMAA